MFNFRNNLITRFPHAIQSLLNNFSEDSIHISARYLLELTTARGWTCEAIFQIKHYAGQSVHYLAVLGHDWHSFCDCMMGVNLGIPCRHFYAVLRCMRPFVRFHLGLFNSR
jgi:hypothetical protein